MFRHLKKFFKVKTKPGQLEIKIFILEPLSMHSSWQFSDKENIILIPKLFEDFEDLKLSIVRCLVSLICRDLSFSFSSETLPFQEFHNQKVIEQGTFLQFICKQLLPEDKLLSFKLYFKLLSQYECGVESRKQVYDWVSLSMMEEFQRKYFLDEIFLNENMTLF